MLTFLDILEKCKNQKNKGLLLETEIDNNFYSYHDIYLKVNLMVQELKRKGFKKYDKVIVPFDTNIETIISILSFMKIGIITFSTKAHYYLRENAKPFLKQLTDAYNISYQLKIDKNNIILINTKKNEEILINLKENNDFNLNDDSVINHDDIAFIQFSSGTTSTPKGIVIKHKDLITQLSYITQQDKRTKDSYIASWLPLYHDMGLIGGLFSNFYYQNNLYLSNPIFFMKNTITWLQKVSDLKINTCPMPDFALAIIGKKLKKSNKKFDFSSWKTLYCGSEPIKEQTIELFSNEMSKHNFNPKAIMPCYGMAETVLMASTRNHMEGTVFFNYQGMRLAGLGYFLSGFEFKIVDEDGTDITNQEKIGEILVKNGSTCSLYYEHKDKLIQDDGYYHTGDLGTILNGELVITGRNGDRLKINAESYFSFDLENHLTSLGANKEGRCAVFQNKDDDLIFIIDPKNKNVLKNKDIYKKKIVNYFMNKLGLSVKFNNILFVRPEFIKKTSSGKLSRNEIKKLYNEGLIKETLLKYYYIDKIKKKFINAKFFLELSLKKKK